MRSTSPHARARTARASSRGSGGLPVFLLEDQGLDLVADPGMTSSLGSTSCLMESLVARDDALGLVADVEEDPSRSILTICVLLMRSRR